MHGHARKSLATSGREDHPIKDHRCSSETVLERHNEQASNGWLRHHNLVIEPIFQITRITRTNLIVAQSDTSTWLGAIARDMFVPKLCDGAVRLKSARVLRPRHAASHMPSVTSVDADLSAVVCPARQSQHGALLALS